MRSAPAFHVRTVPSESLLTIASSDDSTMAAKRAAACAPSGKTSCGSVIVLHPDLFIIHRFQAATMQQSLDAMKTALHVSGGLTEPMDPNSDQITKKLAALNAYQIDIKSPKIPA